MVTSSVSDYGMQSAQKASYIIWLTIHEKQNTQSDIKHQFFLKILDQTLSTNLFTRFKSEQGFKHGNVFTAKLNLETPR
jgi:hypothetical protein